MGKKMALSALAQKKYIIVEGLDPTLTAHIAGAGLEDAFDMIIYGASGNGKSNYTAQILTGLMLALQCRCEYVAYEEAHGKTIRDTLIERANMLELVGNSLVIVDHYTFEELDAAMSKKKSAKIWVIDSLQASRFTQAQIEDLRRKHVKGKRRKILIMISWSDGKLPQGAAAKAIEYNADIKVRVDRLVAFPKSRFQGNLPYIIYEPGAKMKWPAKDFKKIVAQCANYANSSAESGSSTRKNSSRANSSAASSIKESCTSESPLPTAALSPA